MVLEVVCGVSCSSVFLKNVYGLVQIYGLRKNGPNIRSWIHSIPCTQVCLGHILEKKQCHLF